MWTLVKKFRSNTANFHHITDQLTYLPCSEKIKLWRVTESYNGLL